MCGEAALVCGTKEPDIHFCCSAAKIVNTTLDAPLSWRNFAETLQHYKISIGEKDAREAYLDCLAEACLAEKMDEIYATGDEFSNLSDAAEEAEEAGDTETSRRLAKEADEKAQQQMKILRDARAKAESLASVL